MEQIEMMYNRNLTFPHRYQHPIPLTVLDTFSLTTKSYVLILMLMTSNTSDHCAVIAEQVQLPHTSILSRHILT